MNRYEQKPFLRLLDCYLLDSIDQLSDEQRHSLERMEPKLREIYSLEGSWQSIVAKTMDFPESFPEQVKDIWANFLNHSAANGVSVDPNEFVIEFVSQNFPEIVQAE